MAVKETSVHVYCLRWLYSHVIVLRVGCGKASSRRGAYLMTVAGGWSRLGNKLRHVSVDDMRSAVIQMLLGGAKVGRRSRCGQCAKRAAFGRRCRRRCSTVTISAVCIDGGICTRGRTHTLTGHSLHRQHVSAKQLYWCLERVVQSRCRTLTPSCQALVLGWTDPDEKSCSCAPRSLSSRAMTASMTW